MAAQKDKEDRETCRVQTDNLCLKLIELAPQLHPDLVLKQNICQEIEQVLRVEACYLLKQEGPLCCGMKNECSGQASDRSISSQCVWDADLR